ncbi:MAG: SDR family oxidoreductase [Gemmatimonadota bacterium]
MLSIDLSGRVALVTGASGQLGRVMARTLAAAGADVALHYLSNEADARRFAGDVEAAGRRSAVVQADVGDLESVRAMGAAVRAALGDPDIVVTNAMSRIPGWKTVLEQPVEDYENQFRACVLHNVNAAKVFVPAMAARGWGRIIGINTECAMQLKASQSAYGAAKRGMDGVLKVLAREVGRSGITVNEVAPGWTVSDRDREQGTERHAEYEAAVPLGRRGTDQEIANVVAFLASDLASFITGAYVPVSGGNVMPAI